MNMSTVDFGAIHQYTLEILHETRFRIADTEIIDRLLAHGVA